MSLEELLRFRFIQTAVRQNYKKMFGIIGGYYNDDLNRGANIILPQGHLGTLRFFASFQDSFNYAKSSLNNGGVINWILLDTSTGVTTLILTTDKIKIINEYYNKIMFETPEEKQAKKEEIEEYLDAYCKEIVLFPQ